MKYYAQNIEKETLENDNFRKVVFTGEKSQLVLMSIEVDGEIGKEVHPKVDQFFRIESGKGRALLGGEEVEVEGDFAIIVPAGMEHNIINTGDTPLKLYTIYSPANHIDERVHKTKAEADLDTEDEAFGHE